MKIHYLVILLLSTQIKVGAQAGSIDTTFGSIGYVISDISNTLTVKNPVRNS